jgi:Fe-S-cluster containining protein
MTDQKDPSQPSLPWYKEGLKFKCTECGKCCTGQAGFVWVTNEEIAAMAKVMHLSEQTFKIKYVRNRNNRLALVEKKNEAGGYDCIFLKNKKCQIYQARPKQCQTFPWWKENLNTPESWKLAAQDCEGINDQAAAVPYETIKKNLSQN